MELKINADMNAAIDQLSEKLGTTAKDIIPKYAKLAFAQGIIWAGSGSAIAALPWIALPAPGDGEQSFWVWAVRIILTVAGTYTAANWAENIFAPEAVAIDKLINDIRG